MIDRELIEKAESGSVDAIITLGFAYYDREDGEGIIANYNKAETLYNDVIANGEGNYYEDAVFSLALMYATKTNDHYRAFPLWQQLALRGNTTAKYNLGLCYHNGLGTAKDDSQALYWWRQASLEGHADAQSNARILEQEMQGGNNYNRGYRQHSRLHLKSPVVAMMQRLYMDRMIAPRCGH